MATLLSSIGRVDLIQNADRRGVGEEGGEHQGERGQRLLAAGQQRHGLHFFAGWAGENVQPGLERVVFLRQRQARLATAE